jgi:signal transduction histidine kinase
VDEEAHRAARAYRLVVLLLVVVLALVVVFFILRVRSLRKTNERVRLADAAKTRFVQNMSHEVRTPLNAIVGFSQLLSLPDGTFPEAEKEEFAGHIVNNTKMLTMLLDDILNASAMDSGNYRINYEEGEVKYMAEAAISSAEHRLQPGVRMYYVSEIEGPYTFRTDPRRVQQILINLLTNACKHTTSGEIKLTSSLTETPGFVTYSVTDTGTGVPPEQAEKIFERFTKLNDFVQGTGLGLSICRDIASRMGAKVYLDTTYTAGGARFVFAVPCIPDEQK